MIGGVTRTILLRTMDYDETGSRNHLCVCNKFKSPSNSFTVVYTVTHFELGLPPAALSLLCLAQQSFVHPRH